jgi:hypothetical protein
MHSIWGMSTKTTLAAPAGRAAAAAGAAFCNAKIFTWSVVMMAMSLAVVGAGAAMLARRKVKATMVAVGGSCWELVYMQQISWREILLGDQIPEYVGLVDFIAI